MFAGVKLVIFLGFFWGKTPKNSENFSSGAVCQEMHKKGLFPLTFEHIAHFMMLGRFPHEKFSH